MADFEFTEEELEAAANKKPQRYDTHGQPIDIPDVEDPSYQQPGAEAMSSPIDFLVGAGGLKGGLNLGKMSFQALLAKLASRKGAKLADLELQAAERALNLANKSRLLEGAETAASAAPGLLDKALTAAPAAASRTASSGRLPWIGAAGVGYIANEGFDWLKSALGIGANKSGN